MMVFDNPIVRWLATRRKDSMYALACKLNIDCDLLVASQRELKSRVWQCFEDYCQLCLVDFSIFLYFMFIVCSLYVLLRRIK